MFDNKNPTEPQRVLARTLAQPVSENELESLKGGQTAYPCNDQPDIATHVTAEGPGDCA